MGSYDVEEISCELNNMFFFYVLVFRRFDKFVFLNGSRCFLICLTRERATNVTVAAMVSMLLMGCSGPVHGSRRLFVSDTVFAKNLLFR